MEPEWNIKVSAMDDVGNIESYQADPCHLFAVHRFPLSCLVAS